MTIINLRHGEESTQAPEPREHRPTSDDEWNAHLALRISEDDPAALGELIDRFWVPLTSYASRILNDMTAAEDVVQEVFIRVWERRDRWQPRSVTAFLFRMARNLAVDVARSRGTRRERERTRWQDTHRNPSTPAGVFEKQELSETVDRAIQSLPGRQREAFTLAYLENLSYIEIAEVMGISPKTVGNHISAALTQLREVLRPLLKR